MNVSEIPIFKGRHKINLLSSAKAKINYIRSLFIAVEWGISKAHTSFEEYKNEKVLRKLNKRSWKIDDDEKLTD